MEEQPPAISGIVLLFHTESVYYFRHTYAIHNSVVAMNVARKITSENGDRRYDPGAGNNLYNKLGDLREAGMVPEPRCRSLRRWRYTFGVARVRGSRRHQNHLRNRGVHHQPVCVQRGTMDSGLGHSLNHG